ncbi:MAG: DUF2017 family protein [Euzebyales bacterium]|jgi:hypothetical protein|nr:DUF2017 family protein [Euzebyales bacterium]
MFRRHGARRLPGGGLRLVIAVVERDALRQLPDQLRAIADGEAAGPQADAHRARMFPAASDDPETDRTYRELVGSSLAEDRVDQLARFASSLQAGRTTAGDWTVDLDADEAHAWMVVTNDARLVLGNLVGIRSEADWERGPDPADHRSLLLWWLGWLEEQLVQALMGGLEADQRST